MLQRTASVEVAQDRATITSDTSGIATLIANILVDRVSSLFGLIFR